MLDLILNGTRSDCALADDDHYVRWQIVVSCIIGYLYITLLIWINVIKTEIVKNPIPSVFLIKKGDVL